MNILSKENKALLSELVRTDFKLRYQGSLIGYAWSLLKPLLLFVILYVVFVYFLKVGRDIEHFPVYLLLGIVMWNYFTEMTIQSLGSIVARGDLIRKISIPRWMIVISSSISATINFFLSMIVVVIFMIFNGVEFSLLGVLVFPLYFIALYIFSIGFSFLLSALYVKFRDISYIWEVILQAGFYATPIIYPIQMVQNQMIEKILLLNPMATIIQGARHSLINPAQTLDILRAWGNPIIILVPFTIIMAVFGVGVWYFVKNSNTFAENV